MPSSISNAPSPLLFTRHLLAFEHEEHIQCLTSPQLHPCQNLPEYWMNSLLELPNSPPPSTQHLQTASWPAPPPPQPLQQELVSSPRLYLGIYNQAKREERLDRYRAKRRELHFGKVRYSLRSQASGRRIRVKGRFVKSDSVAAAIATDIAPQPPSSPPAAAACSISKRGKRSASSSFSSASTESYWSSSPDSMEDGELLPPTTPVQFTYNAPPSSLLCFDEDFYSEGSI